MSILSILRANNVLNSPSCICLIWTSKITYFSLHKNFQVNAWRLVILLTLNVTFFWVKNCFENNWSRKKVFQFVAAYWSDLYYWRLFRLLFAPNFAFICAYLSCFLGAYNYFSCLQFTSPRMSIRILRYMVYNAYLCGNKKADRKQKHILLHYSVAFTCDLNLIYEIKLITCIEYLRQF